MAELLPIIEVYTPNIAIFWLISDISWQTMVDTTCICIGYCLKYLNKYGKG
jgi:hypothetical protein